MTTSRLKEISLDLLQRVERLSLRERILLFAAVFGIIYSAVDTLILGPLNNKVTELQKQVQTTANESTKMDVEIAKLNMEQKDTPLAQAEEVRKKLEVTEKALQELTSRLIAPEQMVDFVENLLRDNNRLELVSLENLAAMPVMTDAATGEAKTGISIAGGKKLYKHGVSLQIKGRYFDLVEYLSRLEQLPWNVFWAEVSVTTLEYPLAELRLTLYTLSEDAVWLQV